MRPWQPDFASAAASTGCTRPAAGALPCAPSFRRRLDDTRSALGCQERPTCDASQDRDRTVLRFDQAVIHQADFEGSAPCQRARPRRGALRPHCDRPARWLRYVLAAAFAASQTFRAPARRLHHKHYCSSPEATKAIVVRNSSQRLKMRKANSPNMLTIRAIRLIMSAADTQVAVPAPVV